MFRSSGNRLIFSGKTGEEILPVCAAMYNLIQKQGYTDVTLDFSKTTFLDPIFMVPFVATARLYRSLKVDFEIVLPEDPKISAMMVNANWAHLICPERFGENYTSSRNHVSAVQFMNAEEHQKVVNQSMEIMLRRNSGLDRSRLMALEWSLNEITDNVLNHAESPIGGILQMVTFPSKRRVEFYVCDAGIGIAKSLRSGRQDIKDDVTAVRAAIEEGVTRNPNTNQGNGLFGTFKCCEVSKADFDLLTGNVELRYSNTELRVRTNIIPFRGTFIRACINYDVENLLERALVFRGKPHVPVFDYIDRMYQAEKDEIEFIVSNELEAFGSRESGRFARTKIENLMDGFRVPITFNFSNVRLISSSFADEVFGKLFQQLGPIRFGQLCRFKFVDPTVQALIDRAISQRMRQ